MVIIDNSIKGLKALYMRPNELKLILRQLKKLGEPRIELIDRLLRFNEFAIF